MMIITVDEGDVVKVGDTFVHIQKDKRGRVRLGIDGPADCKNSSWIERAMYDKGYTRVPGSNIYWRYQDENERFTVRDILGYGRE